MNEDIASELERELRGDAPSGGSRQPPPVPSTRFMNALWLSSVLCTVAKWLGFFLWVFAGMALYKLWGWILLLVGLLLAGVGVVPLAIAAAIAKGQWGVLIVLISLTIGIVVLRVIGIRIINDAIAHDTLSRYSAP